MRSRHWALLLMLLSLLAALPAAAEVLELQHATLTVSVESGAATTSTVHLPYHWDRIHQRRAGQATFRFPAVVIGRDAAMAIFIPRLGNSYQVLVNQTLLGRHGSFPPDRADAWKPDMFLAHLPPALVGQAIQVEVVIGALPAGQSPGLSTVYIGPIQELEALQRQRQFWEFDSRLIFAGVTLILGVLGLLLWVAEKDPSYLFYGLAELLWTLLTVRGFFKGQFLPDLWWQFFFYELPIKASVVLMFLALLPLLNLSDSRIERGLRALLPLCVPLAALTLLPGWGWLSAAWYVFTTLIVGYLIHRGASQWIRQPNLDNGLMTVVLVTMEATTLRDGLAFFDASQSYVATIWLRFSWLLLGLAFATLIATRLRRSGMAVVRMNASLNERLEQRNKELNTAFEKDKKAVRALGVAEERQRLVQDLHDGLGSHLVGALRIAQSEDSSKEDLVVQLREAIYQMKLTVDAIHEDDGDVASVLGAMRYRLGPRLEAAGIRLNWNVAVLPTVPHWGVSEAYQLQMILLEVFTNMLVHSRAKEAWLTARHDATTQPESLVVTIEDNGIGFDMSSVPVVGKGLNHMRMRATRLEARLQTARIENRTVTILSVPLQPSESSGRSQSSLESGSSRV